MLVLNTETPSHQNQKLFQRDIAVPVQLQRLNLSVTDPPALAMTVQQKDIPKRSTLTRSTASTMRFHQTLVLSLVKGQRHRELIGKGHVLQPIMVTPQREIIARTIVEIDHLNLQTMAIPGGGIGHHPPSTGEDIPNGHQ